jgi:hypothetical protein
MTGPAPPFPGSARASALVVGMEHNEEEPDLCLPGAAGLAAQFARWLIDRGICTPDRIALMTGYQKPEQAPDEPTKALLTELTAGKDDGGLAVTMLRDASADHGFADWIASFPPEFDDELFVLFWMGHGFALRAGKQVCMLGADAKERMPRHVELNELLGKVATYAPTAAQVAFVDVCRNVVADDLEWGAGDWKQTIGKGSYRQETTDQYVIYAAAHGQTTTEAGWAEKSFSKVLLDRLNNLPAGRGPRDFFDETDLDEFLASVAREYGASPFISFHGYAHPGAEKTILSGGRGTLTTDEWRRLLAEAVRIDEAPATAPSRRVLHGAYHHALGRNLQFIPAGITRVEDLVRSLTSIRATEDRPPLIVACDYVANLPAAGAYPGLEQWCNGWSARSLDRREFLGRIRRTRPFRLPMPYLSIEVNDRYYETPSEPQPPKRRDSKRYRVRAILWDLNGFCPLPVSEGGSGKDGRVDEKAALVAEEDILAVSEELLGAAGHEMTRRLSDTPLTEIVLEFVLPECLQSMWPEYGKHRNLGDQYPVVVRDLERLRNKNLGASFRIAQEIYQRIEAFAQERGSTRWSDRVAWITCGRQWPGGQQWPESQVIQGRAGHPETFCIGLAPPMAEMSRYNGDGRTIPGRADALRAGAAIVVLVLHWHKATDRHTKFRNRCTAWRATKMITKEIDKRQHGLLDLPYLLRDIRATMTGNGSWGPQPDLPRIGVVMEEPGRLWPGVFSWGTEDAGAGMGGSPEWPYSGGWST